MVALNTPVCDFGAAMPAFTLPDYNGTIHTSAGLAGEKGLLIAFICNHCPYVRAIADRFAEDAAILAEYGIRTVGIMANDITAYPEDAPEHMRTFAHTHNFDFPYLFDETQAVAKQFGAVCTPDFFGYNADGRLQYRGRFDASGMQKTANSTRELREAMIEVARTGKGPENQIPSIGCSMKWRPASHA